MRVVLAPIEGAPVVLEISATDVAATRPGRAELEVEPAGVVRLMDVCDNVLAPLLFSCRSGECGICAVRVDAGAASLASPTERERATLALRHPTADARVRLGCQVRLREGADVHLTLLR